MELRYAEFLDDSYFFQVSKKIRDFLQDEEGFVEITTPTLSINTPGVRFLIPLSLLLSEE